MTEMKHKSPDARKFRRTRHKRALQPIIEKYGCTQMQVAGVVDGIVSENHKLRYELKQKAEEIVELQRRLAIAESKK